MSQLLNTAIFKKVNYINFTIKQVILTTKTTNTPNSPLANHLRHFTLVWALDVVYNYRICIVTKMQRYRAPLPNSGQDNSFGSLRLAIVEVFTPRKSTNTINEVHFFP